MRMLLAVLVVVSTGCAPSKYYYNFDLTDPGAKNLGKPGERDVSFATSGYTSWPTQ